MLPLHFQSVGSATIAYRRFGSGPPLLLVHGWPFSGLTFRKILPFLADRFDCLLPDLPGAGETIWSEQTSFAFAEQAAALQRFMTALAGGRPYSVVAHDTGGTIARLLALTPAAHLEKLVLLNTEIPDHRPPTIMLLQRLLSVARLRRIVPFLLSRRLFVRSALGFGGCFFNPVLLDREFYRLVIDPLCASPRRIEGYARYLAALDWRIVNDLRQRHRDIRIPVQLIWGENDPTFPIGRAAAMVDQFAHCAGLVTIARAKLLVHEERPEAVADAIKHFLG